MSSNGFEEVSRLGNVKHFLLVFDRRQGRRLSLTPYDDAILALQQRFRAEHIHAENPDIEVIVLTAETKADLQRTHSRYFETLSSLAGDPAKKAAARAPKAAKAPC